jgi:hypothetical protein
LEAAVLINTTTSSKITTNEDAQEEANCQNVFQLTCIGVNEGMAKEIIDWPGMSIMNPILCHLNGVRTKKVDKYLIYELVSVVMEGTERPDPTEI